MDCYIDRHRSNSYSSVKLPALPELFATPRIYPGCCLALSRPLVLYLHSGLSTPTGLVLSVGCGYGLLEALLISSPYNLHIVGVEVAPSSNQHLPPAHHVEVVGSRFLCPLAAEATTWLFVYPKRTGLIDEYMKEYGDGLVRQIVWTGPKADWEDYRQCFRRERARIEWFVETISADEVGGRAWEMIALARKSNGVEQHHPRG